MKKLLLILFIIPVFAFAQTSPATVSFKYDNTQTDTKDSLHFIYPGAVGGLRTLGTMEYIRSIFMKKTDLTFSNGLTKTGAAVKQGGTYTDINLQGSHSYLNGIITGTSPLSLNFIGIDTGAVGITHAFNLSILGSPFTSVTASRKGTFMGYAKPINGDSVLLTIDSNKALFINTKNHGGIHYKYPLLVNYDDSTLITKKYFDTQKGTDLKAYADSLNAAVFSGDHNYNGTNLHFGSESFFGNTYLFSPGSLTENSAGLFINPDNSISKSGSAFYYNASGQFQFNSDAYFSGGTAVFDGPNPIFNFSANWNGLTNYSSNTDNRLLVYSPTLSNSTGYLVVPSSGFASKDSTLQVNKNLYDIPSKATARLNLGVVANSTALQTSTNFNIDQIGKFSGIGGTGGSFNFGVEIGGITKLFRYKAIAGQDYTIFRSDTTNHDMRLAVMPQGSPTGTGDYYMSQYKFFGTDFTADEVNNYDGTIGATLNSIRINSKKNGTATLKPIVFSMQDSRVAFVVDTNQNVTIGSNYLSVVNGVNLNVNKNITGSASSRGIYSQGTIQSDVTNGIGFATNIGTQATAFSPNIIHYTAVQATIGAGSTPSQQTGFMVSSTLTGATTNWGYRGSIASGTGRWNLFMDGSAQNAITGNTRFGSTSVPTAYIHTAAGTATAGTAPFKYTIGTVLTTPETGAKEYDGTDEYLTISTTRFVSFHGLKGSSTLDFPSTAAQTNADLTITVTGAADGDVVSLGVPNVSSNANSSFSARVSAANTVTVTFNNYSSGAIDPASGTFKIAIIK